MGAPRRSAPALRGLCLLLAAAWAQPGQAQESGARGSGITITPRLSLTQTVTDNLALSPDGQRDAALVTAITPGLSVLARTGMLRGTLDYSLDGIVYAKTEQKNRVQNQLRAQGTAELVPQQLTVDLNGSISRQSLSAFGPQSSNPLLDNANQTEVRQFGVTPRWRGELAGLLRFDLSGDIQWRNARSSADGDGRDEAVLLSLSSLRAGRLTWGGNASVRRMHFSQAQPGNRSESANATLDYQGDIDWRLGVSAGLERSNYLGSDTSGTYGLRGGWSPGPRTSLTADWQHHRYGDSHSLSFEHRMSRLVLRASSNQSVTGNAGPSGALTNYQLFDLQYMALEPDPVKRDQLVRATLRSLGLSPDTVGSSGFVNNAPMLSRQTNFSLAWQGVRTTVSVAFNDGRSRRLGAAPASGDLSLSSAVVQRGGSISASYRLTPSSSASLSYSDQRSLGDDGVGGSEMRSLTGNWSVRLGPQTDAVLGLRTVRSSAVQANASPLNAYKENALYVQLTQRF